jgi:hypothetical protein
VEQVLVKAFIPRDLKRRAFGVLAIQEESFSAWLRAQLESFVEQAEPIGHESVRDHDNAQKSVCAG